MFYNILISVCPILALSWLSEKELSKDQYASIFFIQLSYQKLKSFANAKHNHLRKPDFFIIFRALFYIKKLFVLKIFLIGDFKK